MTGAVSPAVAPAVTPAVTPEQAGQTPSVRTLPGLLARCAQDAGDREFLRFGETSWTFADIDAWTSRLAHRFLETDGIEPGDRIAIMLPNVVHWPVAWLAAQKAGAVVVPINSSYQRADLAFVLTDSGARVVVTDGPAAVGDEGAGKNGAGPGFREPYAPPDSAGSQRNGQLNPLQEGRNMHMLLAPSKEGIDAIVKRTQLAGGEVVNLPPGAYRDLLALNDRAAPLPVLDAAHATAHRRLVSRFVRHHYGESGALHALDFWTRRPPPWAAAS